MLDKFLQRAVAAEQPDHARHGLTAARRMETRYAYAIVCECGAEFEASANAVAAAERASEEN